MEKQKLVVRPPCPHCGSRNVAWIQWGRPRARVGFSEQLKRHEITLGGCFMSVNSERWECNECGFRFGNIGLAVCLLAISKRDKKIRDRLPQLGILPLKQEESPIPGYITAHDKSWRNEKEIKDSQICGCFNCLNFFVPAQIKEWVEDILDQKTALCPYCSMDAVIADASGYPMTEEFFRQMHEYWSHI